ncbi:hypothetical protein KAI92_03835 [Candidatus Parcubacteria bacterium]|nr:hypothetical protein [Candidatus Parcubacteria bacterium]
MKRLIIALFVLMLICTFSVTYAQEQKPDLVQRALDKTREMSNKAKNKYTEHKEKKKDHFTTISGVCCGKEKNEVIDNILCDFSNQVGGIKGFSIALAPMCYYTITIWY